MDGKQLEQLAVEFSKGNPVAFAEVDAMFRKELLTFATDLTASATEGEKITNYCFEKIKRMHKEFNTMVNIKAFLYITTRNNSLSYLKSIKEPLNE
jgi:DNA-directed RNA polymerase specialized sigma24 family protein